MRAKIAPLILLFLAPLPVFAYKQTITAKLTVFPDGWVDVVVEVHNPPDRLMITLQGELNYLTVIDEKGLALPYEAQGSRLLVDAQGAEVVEISYQTPDLTSKEAGVWNLSVSLPVSSLEVRFPKNSRIIGLSEVPEEIAEENGWLILTFSTGRVKISYRMGRLTLPLRTGQPAPESSEPYTTTERREDTGIRQVEQSAEHEGVEGVRKNEGVLQPLAIYLTPVVLILLLTVLLLKRRSPTKIIAPDTLTEDVLANLREAGGEMRQADLIRQLGLPRTTVWRRLRRLEEQGLLKIERRGRDTIIRLVNDLE